MSKLNAFIIAVHYLECSFLNKMALEENAVKARLKDMLSGFSNAELNISSGIEDLLSSLVDLSTTVLDSKQFLKVSGMSVNSTEFIRNINSDQVEPLRSAPLML